MKTPKMMGGSVQSGLSSREYISAAVADEPKEQSLPTKASAKMTTVKKAGKSFEIG